MLPQKCHLQFDNQSWNEWLFNYNLDILLASQIAQLLSQWSLSHKIIRKLLKHNKVRNILMFKKIYCNVATFFYSQWTLMLQTEDEFNDTRHAKDDTRHRHNDYRSVYVVGSHESANSCKIQTRSDKNLSLAARRVAACRVSDSVCRMPCVWYRWRAKVR